MVHYDYMRILVFLLLDGFSDLLIIVWDSWFVITRWIFGILSIIWNSRTHITRWIFGLLIIRWTSYCLKRMFRIPYYKMVFWSSYYQMDFLLLKVDFMNFLLPDGFRVFLLSEDFLTFSSKLVIEFFWLYVEWIFNFLNH